MLTKSPFFRSTAFRLEDLSPVPSGVFSLLILQAPGSRARSQSSVVGSPPETLNACLVRDFYCLRRTPYEGVGVEFASRCLRSPPAVPISLSSILGTAYPAGRWNSSTFVHDGSIDSPSCAGQLYGDISDQLPASCVACAVSRWLDI